MSNRTLIEFNHDYAGQIMADEEGFMLALGRYLNSADKIGEQGLERYGVRVIGMRHHSEPVNVRWPGTGRHWSAP